MGEFKYCQILNLTLDSLDLHYLLLFAESTKWYIHLSANLVFWMIHNIPLLKLTPLMCRKITIPLIIVIRLLDRWYISIHLQELWARLFQIVVSSKSIVFDHEPNGLLFLWKNSCKMSLMCAFSNYSGISKSLGPPPLWSQS